MCNASGGPYKYCELLALCSGAVEVSFALASGVSMGDLCCMFQDSVVISSSGVKMDFLEKLRHHYRIWSKPQRPWNSGDIYALNGGFTRLRTQVPHVSDFTHSNSSSMK